MYFFSLSVVTFIYNYVNHILFFTACLAIHERRIDSLRHCCTCRKLESREKLRESGASFCTICCCSGRRATSREQIESPMEKLARILLSRYVLTPVVKTIAVIVCICYIAATIYGVINLQVDSIQPREVKDISYFSHFETVDLNHFPREYTLSFTIMKSYDYQHYSSNIQEYINNVKQLKLIENQTHFWCDSHGQTGKNSSLVQQLRVSFLSDNPIFANDVLMSSDNGTILASRFYMKTKSAPSTKEMIVLKKKLKKIYLLPYDFDETAYKLKHDMDNDDDDDFDDDDYEDMLEENNIILANSPDFIHTDSYRLPLKEIIRIAAGYLATSCFLTLLFVPHPFLPFHMAIMFISFLLGIIGISYYVGIYITPVPMIVIMFGCGYGVEVIIHSYYGYMTSKGTDRGSRTNSILSTASPILFHTNFASFLGLLVLLVVESYVFQTVFRVLEVSLALCVLYAVFFIPVSLAFTGPGSISLPGSSKVVETDSKTSKNILDQVGTQMSNGIEPLSNGNIKNGGVVHNGGSDNLGFEKV